MMQSKDMLAHASAKELAAAVRAKSVSAVELTDAAIARIEARDGPINAVVVRDFDRAREQARAVDKAIAEGADLPLAGVPMTVKESFNVAGLPTSFGLAFAKDHRPAEDADAVRRLKEAGAVILGKTNVAPGLADYQSDNPVYGRTNNPHDLSRSAGGSSGGSAAALAAGMVPLELGSDAGGSIRVPAHFCGVFGHKPSHGLLPLRGQQFPGTDGAAIELAVGGPLARSAADLDLALGVLAGPDALQAVGYRLALPPPRHTALRGCRVLLLDEHPAAATDTSVRAVLARVADELRQAGAVVARASPLLPDLAAAHKAYLGLLMTITSRGAPDAPDVISAHQWFGLLDHQAIMRRQWQALFDAHDVVLAPPFGCVAFEHIDEADWSRRVLAIDGTSTPYGDQLAWPGIATFANLPATVAPVGADASGLPVGVQVIGPYLEDRTTIAFAGLLTGGRAVPPVVPQQRAATPGRP
jgi:amidase